MSDKSKPQSISMDEQVMLAIIKEMGMSDYDPKTVIQLTEFVYKYVCMVLEEARHFADNTKIKFVDVQAGLHVLGDRIFVPTLPREISTEYVRAINNTPLPPVKPNCGLRLPHQGINLTNPNYGLPKKTTTGYDAVARTGIKLIKPLVTYSRRVTTGSPAVAQQQNVIVPPIRISLLPKLKIKAPLPTINGFFKRKRQEVP